MSTLKTTYIQHPSAESPAIELDATDGVVFSAASFDASVITSGVFDAARVPDVANAAIGSNVVQTVNSSTFSASLTANNFSADAITVTITPTSASSKILLIANLNIGASMTLPGFRLLRGVTAIAIADAEGSRPRLTGNMENGNVGATHTLMSMTFLDSPATTSATTYAAQLHNAEGSTQTLYLNRNNTDSNDRLGARTISTITAIEVAA